MQKAENTTDQNPGNNNEYLSFTLGDEEYAMDILKVQEIRGYDTVTSIANTPDFIKGVINLRGIVVPIVDMRIKFNLDDISYNATTVVIILNIGERVIGMVVDGVSDVINLSDDQIKPVPEFSSLIDTKYLKGLGTVDERMLILLSIDDLLNSSEMELSDINKKN